MPSAIHVRYTGQSDDGDHGDGGDHGDDDGVGDDDGNFNQDIQPTIHVRHQDKINFINQNMKVHKCTYVFSWGKS